MPLEQATYPDNNPKTSIGVSKAPLHAIPPVAIIHLGLAMENGKTKYGLMNWREKTVSSSVYYDAILRHLMSWWDGENVAQDSRVHHLGHVMACCAILLDADLADNLNDDRPKVPGATAEFLDMLFKLRSGELKAVPAAPPDIEDDGFITRDLPSTGRVPQRSRRKSVREAIQGE